METAERGPRWTTILAGCLVLIVAAGVAIPIVRLAQRRNRVAACANNLSQMWKMQNIYMGGYGFLSADVPLDIAPQPTTA